MQRLQNNGLNVSKYNILFNYIDLLALPAEVLAELNDEIKELLSMITLRVDGTHTPVMYVSYKYDVVVNNNNIGLISRIMLQRKFLKKNIGYLGNNNIKGVYASILRFVRFVSFQLINISKVSSLMNSRWALASASGPCSFWDDVSQMKRYVKEYRKNLDKRDCTIRDKVHLYI